MRFYPFCVFFYIACVNDHHKIFRVELIDQYIVHFAAVFVKHKRIFRLTDFHNAYIVSQQSLQCRFRAFSLKGKFAHVGNVKKTYVISYGVMLENYAFAELNRHFKTCKIDHFSAQRNHCFIVRCAFHLFLREYIYSNNNIVI